MSYMSKKIKSRMQDLNMSQKELAQKVGVAEATISGYIKNERTPCGEIIPKIAAALNVTSDYLFGTIYKDNINSKTNEISANVSLKDEIIDLMIKYGYIKNINNINNDHIKLIEMSILTYTDKIE